MGLTCAGFLAAQGGPQPIVGQQDELLPGVAGFADDAFAVDVQPDDFEFPHADLLRASAKPD
jgi:hypothetical protein